MAFHARMSIFGGIQSERNGNWQMMAFIEKERSEQIVVAEKERKRKRVKCYIFENLNWNTK